MSAARSSGLNTLQPLRDTINLPHERGVSPDVAVIMSGDLVNHDQPESSARREFVDERGEVRRLCDGNTLCVVAVGGRRGAGGRGFAGKQKQTGK